MNESQKAEIIVKDYAGNVISPGYYSIAIVPADVAHLGPWTGGDFPKWIVADKPGSAVVTITHNDGRSGALDLLITAAPLLVSLGEPVAK